MNINPLFQVDFYKTSHQNMYPDGTTKIFSNLTPRKSRIPGINSVVFFGLQYFIKEYLIKQWDEGFFNNSSREAWKNSGYHPDKIEMGINYIRDTVVIPKYKRLMDNTLGKDSVSTKHLEDLWDLGYLPLEIKALPEGSLCPIGVPCLTITNTVDHAYWLVNYLETILSCTVWQPITSATLAHEYKKLLSKYALETTGNTEGVQWQGHDFSMRGMSSLESACTSGAGHLLSFTGTDTIPAISFLEDYYNANVEKELVGASVPATEHSIACMYGKQDEVGQFKTLLNKYPKGILSVVSDTWDLWKVCTDYVVQLKNQILARDGKLVIRPDSGDPVKIICGWNMSDLRDFYDENHYKEGVDIDENAKKGVIELLWDVFGGTINEQGYKVLDSHIGAIYGDSITLERAESICERLKAKGFASTNIVLGIGSFTYQHNTRDTFGFAMKATYGEVLELVDYEYPTGDETNDGNGTPRYEPVGREIFKDPITDDGTKKSAKGLLRVEEVYGADSLGKLHHTGYQLFDQQTKEQELGGALEAVFLDGELIKDFTLAEIRKRLSKQL